MRKEYDFDKMAGRKHPPMNMVFKKMTGGCSIVTGFCPRCPGT